MKYAVPYVPNNILVKKDDWNKINQRTLPHGAQSCKFENIQYIHL